MSWLRILSGAVFLNVVAAVFQSQPGMSIIPYAIVEALATIFVLMCVTSFLGLVVMGTIRLVYGRWLTNNADFLVSSGVWILFAGIGCWLAFGLFVGHYSIVTDRSTPDRKRMVTAETHTAYFSRLSFHFVPPQRGDVILIASEADAGLRDWRLDVPPRYHVREGDPPPALRRVLAMPGETVTIEGTTVTMSGVVLQRGNGSSEKSSKTVVHLGDKEYLSACDNADAFDDERGATYAVIDERQILSHELFVLWPPRLFGRSQKRRYGVEDQPPVKFDPENATVRRLVFM